jgi:hypothetical protein
MSIAVLIIKAHLVCLSAPEAPYVARHDNRGGFFQDNQRG